MDPLERAELLGIVVVVALIAGLLLLGSAGFRAIDRAVANNEDAHAAAVIEGRVVKGMSEAEVVKVWGPPDAVSQIMVTGGGWFSTTKSYFWTYYEPYRRVIFSYEMGIRYARVRSVLYE